MRRFQEYAKNLWDSLQAVLFYVYSPDSVIQERSRTLLYLLCLFVGLCIPVVCLEFLFARSFLPPFLVIVLVVIIPSFALARAGRATAATIWFLLCYSLTISGLGALGAQTTGSEAALPVVASLLTFSVVVAALLIAPRAAILMGLVNGVLFLGVYALWYTFSVSLRNHPYTFTTFVTPIYIQALLAGVCWLLARERQKAIQRAESESKLLSDIIEQLPIGIAVFEVETLTVYRSNGILEKLIGPLNRREQIEARRNSKREVVEYDDSTVEAEPGALPWETVKNSGKPLGRSETLIIHPKSSEAPISIEEKVMPIVNNGKPTHILYVAVNVTKRRFLQHETRLLMEDFKLKMKEAQTASHLKSEFLANMSHELRTPLIGIIGHADLMLTDPRPLPDSVAPSVKAIYKSGKHLLNLINNLLDEARLDAGQMHLNIQRLDMCDIVRDVIETMKIIAQDKALSLTYSVPETPVNVFGDEVRLNQVVYNLIANAIKFTERGAVRVQLIVHGDQAQLAVQDTGAGIAPSLHKKIFERFFQAKDDAATRRLGSGLGLAITHELVVLHRGKIWVHSTPGRGSTFTFSIPLAEQLTEAPGAALPKWHGDYG